MRSLLSGLVAYWPLHEASGSRYDALGHLDMTDNATVTGNLGIVENASQFTAANSEYLSRAGDDAALSTGDIDYTFWAWVYLDSKGADRVILSKYGAAGVREYLFYFNNAADRIQFLVSNDGTAATTLSDTSLGSPATATWYFIRAWHDSVANVLGIQSNLNAVVTTAHTTGSFDSTSAFLIGANNSATPALFWNGRICEVGFTKRLLTDAEHWWLYKWGMGRTYPFDGRISPTMLGRHPALIGPRKTRVMGLLAA